MSTNQPSAPADDEPVSGREPALTNNGSVPPPVTGDEPTLSGDEGLLHALEMTLHGDRQIRFNAVAALEQFKGVNVLERLLNMLADPDQNLRNRAAWALIRFGDDAVPGLLDTVQSSRNQQARNEAAWALSMMELPSYVPELVALLGNEQSEDTQGLIVQALCRVGTDSALAGLAQYLQRSQQESIPGLHQVLSAFEKAHYVTVGPLLLDILPIVPEYHQDNVIDTLAALNYQPACDVLLQVANNPEEFDIAARRAAIKGLHTLRGDPFIPQLIQLFNDGDTELKIDIMVVMADINGPQAAKLIRTHLRSDNANIQSQAIHLAGNLKDVQSVPTLIELLSDVNIQVRSSIVRALGEIGDERAILPLKNILDSLEMVWLNLAEGWEEPWVQSRDRIIPALRSIDTFQAQQIIEQWESENPEPPPDYWEWWWH